MILRLRSLLPFLLLLALTSCFLQSRPRRAQRQLEKDHYQKAEKLLKKDIAKDSLNPAAYWLLSQLYLDSAYRQNIDSAHLLILKALRQAPLEERKDQKRWRKLALDSPALALQHQLVDSAAFVRASQANTVASYQYFLTHYPLALQLPEATERRNALAFAAAEAINTWQAYQQFFQTYPQARQVAEARERYEELLFKERTQTGTLQAYRRFLADFPQTPYRNRLLRNIYRLSTAEHTPQSYYQYIRRYPNNPYSRQALAQLYYLHGQPATLWQKYPQLPRPDSLSILIKLADQQVIAVMQEGKWGFASEKGSFVLAPTFDDVHPDYLCESLERDFAEVFAQGHPQLVAWNGVVLLQEDYERVAPLGPALLRIQQEGRQGLLLKTGEWLLQPDYSSIRQFGTDLILVKQERQQGLLAPNGQWLLMPQADSLARLQDFVLRFRNNRIAVQNRAQLIEAAQENTRPSPNFRYQSVRLLGDSLLLGNLPDSSWQILAPNLSVVASGPAGTPQAIPGGFVVQQGNAYQILNKSGRAALEGQQQQYQLREDKLAIKQNNRWRLLRLPSFGQLSQGHDSLLLLHPRLVWTRTGKQDSLHFLGRAPQKIPLQPSENVRILRPQYVPDSLLRQRDSFDKVMVSSGRNLRVYSLEGKLLLQGRYEDITAPDPALLVLKTQQGTATLADTSGQSLLKGGYDAIGNYHKGYLALLKGNRFGIYNPYRQLLLGPQFDAVPRPYNQQLLVASKGRQWGLVDSGGKVVLPHRYDNIQYWTDTLALVQQGDAWQLLNIYDGQPLLTNLLEVKWLRDPQSPKGGLAIVEAYEGYGLISTTKGILAAPTFNDIQNLGSAQVPLLYLERQKREENLYEITYLNEEGNPIFQNLYTQAEWQMLLCD